nr:THAP domain-containing protein 3-like [Nerophis lumbriciformis]
MPVTCASVGCNNKFVKGSEIRFYRFPLSKPSLSARWVQSLGLRNFIPSANTCLCSEHFSPDCFRDYNGKQFLREDAVPNVFTLNYENEYQCHYQRISVSQITWDITERGTKEENSQIYAEKKEEVQEQSMGKKVYDGKGRLLSNGKDMCDCLDVECMGCFYPCSDCGSRKCGFECRCDRKWLYEQMEVEGGEIIRNKFAF